MVQRNEAAAGRMACVNRRGVRRLGAFASFRDAEGDDGRPARRAAHAAQFLLGRSNRDLQALGLAHPAVFAGLHQSRLQICVDLGKTLKLRRVRAEHRAPYAGVLVLAGGAIGTATHSEFHLAPFEVPEEFLPFSVRRFSILLTRSQFPAPSNKRSVVGDHVLIVDGDVALCGGQVLVPEDLGGNVYR